MITINGQKMGKSLGNFITLEQLFSGDHALLERAYAPMTIRFFILQAHYRSTVDFSNEALDAAEKGLKRMAETYERLLKIEAKNESTVEVSGLRERCDAAMADDLNSPMVIAELFDASRAINVVYEGKGSLSAKDLDELKDVFKTYLVDILGLRFGDADSGNNGQMAAFKGAVELLLRYRQKAKQNKDWATSDEIRNELQSLGFTLKDGKDHTDWSL